MATTAEKQALGFLVAVALTGAAVQAIGVDRFDAQAARAGKGADTSTSMGEQALAGQLAAIDSARAAKPTRKGGAGRGRRSRSASQSVERPVARAEPTPRQPPPPVDVNAASAAELERLPRVGPALAARIVAWRERHGPFGGPEDLRHVRGIGPSTVRLLLPLVTFSGRSRPLLSEGPPQFASYLTTTSVGHPDIWQLPQLH